MLAKSSSVSPSRVGRSWRTRRRACLQSLVGLLRGRRLGDSGPGVRAGAPCGRRDGDFFSFGFFRFDLLDLSWREGW